MDIYPSSMEGMWNRFFFLRLVYQEREEAVDNLMIQMLDDVVLSMVFFPNRPFSLNCQWIFRNL